MLYQFGPLSFDTFPFNVDEVSRDTASDFAKHAVIGSRKPFEHTGEGDETIRFSAQLLPLRIGGQIEMQILHGLRAAGEAHILMRGDGIVLGTYVVTAVSEGDSMLAPSGAAQIKKVSVTFERTEDLGLDMGAAALAQIIGLFS